MREGSGAPKAEREATRMVAQEANDPVTTALRSRIAEEYKKQEKEYRIRRDYEKQ